MFCQGMYGVKRMGMTEGNFVKLAISFHFFMSSGLGCRSAGLPIKHLFPVRPRRCSFMEIQVLKDLGLY